MDLYDKILLQAVLMFVGGLWALAGVFFLLSVLDLLP